MTPRALALTLLLACVPTAGVDADAGFVIADNPAPLCGQPYEPCCAASPSCAHGWTCRDDRCVAPSQRCVATGVADPELTRLNDWDTSVNPPDCAAMPAILVDPEAPALYRSGDRDIGVLDCEGVTPGAHRLRVRLSARALAPWGDFVTGCRCVWNIELTWALRVNGTLVLTARVDGPDDPSCRVGVSDEITVPLTVGSDGRLRVSIDLVRCRRRDDTSCLFARGTEMELDP